MAGKKDTGAEKDGRGRRGNGSISERPDGTYMGQITLGYGLDGKRQRKTVYGKTKTEVQRKLRELQVLQVQGKTVPLCEGTVADLTERWLEQIVKPRLKHTTFRSYEQIARVHILPALGKSKLSKLAVEDLDRFFQAKLDSGLAPQTVRYLRGIMRRMFRYAQKWRLVGENPVLLSDPITVRRARTPSMTPDEARRLLAAFRGHRYEAIYTVALGLGLRIGEVLGLRWEDVWLDPQGESGTLTVRFQLQRVAGKYALTSPKSETSERTLHLPWFVARALVARREQQRDEAIAGGAGWANSLGLVFTNIHGGPMDDARIRQRFKELLAAKGFAHLRLHDLRHICASLLLAQGIPAKIASEVLGHSQIKLTLDTYTHVMPSAKAEAAKAVGRAFYGFGQEDLAD